MSTATATAEQKLQEILNRGKHRVPEVLQMIEEEILNRQDYIVAPTSVNLEYEESQFFLTTPEFKGRLTGWSKNQLFTRADIPIRFVDKLIKYELIDTLYMLFKAILPKASPDGLFIRKVRDTIKAVLSTRYKRFDSAMFLESFVKTCMDNAYMPFNASISDTSYYLEFVYPKITYVGDDPIVFKIVMQTSDYGANALKLEAGVLRVMCVNGIVGFNLFRQVHLGRRFRIDDELSITRMLSDETVELDTKTVASAVRDIVKNSIDVFDKIRMLVEKSVDTELSDEKANELLARFWKDGHLTKTLYETILNVYKAPLPVEVLPQEKNTWRLANAIAYVAQHNDELSEDDRVELERLAYNVL